MDIGQIEANFGFTKAMAKLYLAGLEYGPLLMAHLAMRANVKRTTAYYVMAELLRRGFFSKKKLGKRTGYVAASPEHVLEMTLERERQVRKLLPALNFIKKKEGAA